MKILFTLDYELFLGACTGTVAKCLIEPMQHLIEATKDYGVKFTIFVDAVYLLKLKEYSSQYPSLSKDLGDIQSNLLSLKEDGHDIQLHIHPHWYFSKYNGSCWELDDNHYKLSDLSEDQALGVFKKAKLYLDELVGIKTIAYRAGGFSAQPTSLLTKCFGENELLIDSSVYPGNYYNSTHQAYDYRNCPKKSIYRFDEDICAESEFGRFVELPLSTIMLSPIFYWKLVVTKLMKAARHKNFGDGVSVKTTSDSIKERLLKKTSGFVTIDGYKCSYLKRAYNLKKDKEEILCVIGHPKLATPYSVKTLAKFCASISGDYPQYITISELM